MGKIEDVVEARNNLAVYAAELAAFKIRPWNFWKVLKHVSNLQCMMLQICGELMVSDHHIIEGIERCVTADLLIDQRVSKVWQEVYAIEEKRRQMETIMNHNKEVKT